jgi:hypothetical protein
MISQSTPMTNLVGAVLRRNVFFGCGAASVSSEIALQSHRPVSSARHREEERNLGGRFRIATHR